MRKIISIVNTGEVEDRQYYGRAYRYLDENTPEAYGQCPDCNSDIHYGGASCPDKKLGCCVAHYDYGCSGCKKVFNLVVEREHATGLEEPFRVVENIGIAIINPRAIRNLK